MVSDDKFKEMLKQYHNGTLNEEDERKIEDFLEKYDRYNELLNQTDEEEKYNVSGEKILRKAQQKLFFRNAIVAMSLFLVILPVLTFISIIYYGSGGENGRGNDIIKTVETISEVTVPNVYVDSDTIEHEIFPFNMNVVAHKYTLSEYGKKDLGKDHYQFFWNTLYNKESDYQNDGYSIENIDRYFVHPDSSYVLEDESAEIEQLPSGMPVEVNVSLKDVYLLSDIRELFKRYDITWFAIDTGVEGSLNNDWDFNQTPAVGFPNIKVTGDLYKEFLSNLKFLNKHERVATSLTNYKDLKLGDRINNLEKNKDVQIYGLTLRITPEKIEDLLKIKEVKIIRLLER